MRFKAKLAMEQVHLLHSLIGPISRLTSSSSSSSFSSSADAGMLSSQHYPRNTGGGGGGGTVIHLDPDTFRISTRASSSSSSSSDSGGVDGITCFVEFATQNGIFLEHRIESASDNVIVFELDLSQLKVALQSVLASAGQETAGGVGGGGGGGGRRRAVATTTTTPLHNSNAPVETTTRTSTTATKLISMTLGGSIIIMKLAKRNGRMPCLCLDASCCGGSVEVHHAIPVKIMRAVEMQYNLPPRISMPDVQLELPVERPLRTVVERLRTISPHVYLEGSMGGELTLRIDGDGASIRTFYSKLIPRFEDTKSSSAAETNGGTNSTSTAEPARCTLKVDSKKLYACLQWQATMIMGRMVSSAILCMVENEMLVLHVLLNPGNVGFFTYYIPVHYLSPDEMD